jgi:hypothetical protein
MSFIASAVAAIGNATRRQSVDTTLPDFVDPVEEEDNTTTYVVIVLLILLLGGTAFYFISSSKKNE